MASSGIVQTLSEELLADPVSKANNATKLLAAVNSPRLPEASVQTALRALSVFLTDQQDHTGVEEVGSEDAEDAYEEYRAWLERLKVQYKLRLCKLLVHTTTPALQVTVFSSILDLCKGGKEEPFCPGPFTTALQLSLCSRNTSSLLLSTLLHWMQEFLDIRYFAMKTLHRLAQGEAKIGGPKPRRLALSTSLLRLLPQELQVPSKQLYSNMYALLAEAGPFPMGKPGAAATEGEEPPKSWCGALEAGAVRAAHTKEGGPQRKKRRREEAGGGGGAGEAGRVGARWATPGFQRGAFTQAWTSFLCLRLPGGLFKKALRRLPEDVIPHLANPLLLADLLSGALEAGGLVAMLALHAVFVLVTQHGLEYPGFYARLYCLLQPAALEAAPRGRFFELADVFLSSSLVPAYTAAAFVKRFSRLALHATPPSALVCLAFVHNLLRRHPACLVLVDRPAGGAPPPREDPYRADVADPAASNALESSLWEVDALAGHFHPRVAAAAKQILEKDLADRRKTAEVDPGPLLAQSPLSLLAHELGRRTRRAASAAPRELPDRPFEDAHTSAILRDW